MCLPYMQAVVIDQDFETISKVEGDASFDGDARAGQVNPIQSSQQIEQFCLLDQIALQHRAFRRVTRPKRIGRGKAKARVKGKEHIDAPPKRRAIAVSNGLHTNRRAQGLGNLGLIIGIGLIQVVKADQN